MKRFIGLHLDFIGFVGSTLCAIHCAIVPILIAMGLFKSAFFSEHQQYEDVFVFGAALIALISLSQSYFRKHRNILPLLISASGFVLILLFHHDHGSMTSAVAMIFAGLMVAGAHFFNWRLVQNFKAK